MARVSERRRVMVKDQTYVENMARERTPSLEMVAALLVETRSRDMKVSGVR